MYVRTYVYMYKWHITHLHFTIIIIHINNNTLIMHEVIEVIDEYSNMKLRKT